MNKLYPIILFLITTAVACKNGKSVDPLTPVDPVEEISIKEQVNIKIALIDSLGIFSQYLKAASIPKETKEVTILAPSNALFGQTAVGEKLPDGSSVEDYIIKGKIDLSKTSEGQILTTINDKQLTVHRENGNTYLNGVIVSTTVILSDIGYNVYSITTLLESPKEYVDPNADKYFIEFYDNGKYTLVKNTIKPWEFFSNAEWQPLVTEGGACNVKVNYYFVENPGLQTNVKAFSWSVFRPSGSSLPELGDYTNVNKKGRLSINGAEADCNNALSFYKFTVKEVKILSESGLEKKGFYSGEFEAILYSGGLGSEQTEHIIRKGKFMLPIGGKTPIVLKGQGNPPVQGQNAILLTQDKWYVYSLTDPSTGETYIYKEDPQYKACDLDNYIVFDPNGAFKTELGVKCIDNEVEENGIWTMDKDATKLIIETGGITASLKIFELSESVLSISTFDVEEPGENFITTYKHTK